LNEKPLLFGKERSASVYLSLQCQASLAWVQIPCFPNRRQKNSFRDEAETLKRSAAAFA
jgi:hypothetical protein